MHLDRRQSVEPLPSSRQIASRNDSGHFRPGGLLRFVRASGGPGARQVPSLRAPIRLLPAELASILSAVADPCRGLRLPVHVLRLLRRWKT